MRRLRSGEGSASLAQNTRSGVGEHGIQLQGPKISLAYPTKIEFVQVRQNYASVELCLNTWLPTSSLENAPLLFTASCVFDLHISIPNPPHAHRVRIKQRYQHLRPSHLFKLSFWHPGPCMCVGPINLSIGLVVVLAACLHAQLLGLPF